MRFLTRLALITALLLCGLSSLAQTRYTLIDLGTLYGGNSVPTGINIKGQIVGWSDTLLSSGFGGSPFHHAFFWDSATGIMDLGTLANPFKGDFAEAHGINDASVVGGWSTTFPGDPGVSPAAPFRWDSVHGLQALDDHVGLASYGFGINNKSQVIGMTRINDPDHGWPYHASLFDPVTGYQDLGTLPGYFTAQAFAINDNSQILGTSYSDFLFGASQEFLWDSVNGFQIIPTLPPYPYTFAFAINNAGTMVGALGFLYPDFGVTLDHAALWNGLTSIQDLGTLPNGFISDAYGLNNVGQIVGFSGSTDVDRSGTPRNHAVLWNTPSDLQDLHLQVPVKRGWVLNNAVAINDKGQIAATLTRDFGGPSHAVLLTPAPTPTQFASDVSAKISVKRGGFRVALNGLIVQRVTLKNISSQPIAGPLSLVLDNLGDYISLDSLDGYTNYRTPLGHPYINVPVGSDNKLTPGETVTVDLQFATATYYIGSFVTIKYTARLLAGAGAR